MNIKEKLEILNSIECIDYDSDGETLYEFWVEATKQNHKLLESLGVPKSVLMDEVIFDEGCLDIKDIAFKYCGAKWYCGDRGWIDFIPNEEGESE